MSFTYKINNRGPSIEPCDTPQVLSFATNISVFMSLCSQVASYRLRCDDLRHFWCRRGSWWMKRNTKYIPVCLCACVRACVRVCMCVCVYVCVRACVLGSSYIKCILIARKTQHNLVIRSLLNLYLNIQ